MQKIHSSKSPQGEILIVDDTPANLHLLGNMLTEYAYKVHPVLNGRLALSVAQGTLPDLILLDINMPEIDGYEVCRRLKAGERTCDIPVIFLSAMNNAEDIMRGFEVGGVDYVTKPFNSAELLARVKTHISLRKAHIELQHAQLQLLQAEKMASLGTLVAGVAHEINNPTNAVYVTVYNLQNNISDLKEFVSDLSGDDADEEITQIFDRYFDKMDKNINNIKEVSVRIKTIIQDLHTFSRLDGKNQKKANVVNGIRSTLSLVKTRHQSYVEFIEDFQVEPQVKCWATQLNQVFMNIITNACQAIEFKQKNKEKTSEATLLQEQARGSLKIHTQLQGEKLLIQFQDTGCGMSDDVQSKIFDPFFTTKGVGEGTGLGMSISYNIIEKHQGSITVESQLDKGTTVNILLPLPEKEEMEQDVL